MDSNGMFDPSNVRSVLTFSIERILGPDFGPPNKFPGGKLATKDFCTLLRSIDGPGVEWPFLGPACSPNSPGSSAPSPRGVSPVSDCSSWGESVQSPGTKSTGRQLSCEGVLTTFNPGFDARVCNADPVSAENTRRQLSFEDVSTSSIDPELGFGVKLCNVDPESKDTRRQLSFEDVPTSSIDQKMGFDVKLCHVDPVSSKCTKRQLSFGDVSTSNLDPEMGFEVKHRNADPVSTKRTKRQRDTFVSGDIFSEDPDVKPVGGTFYNNASNFRTSPHSADKTEKVSGRKRTLDGTFSESGHKRALDKVLRNVCSANTHLERFVKDSPDCEITTTDRTDLSLEGKNSERTCPVSVQESKYVPKSGRTLDRIPRIPHSDLGKLRKDSEGDKTPKLNTDVASALEKDEEDIRLENKPRSRLPDGRCRREGSRAPDTDGDDASRTSCAIISSKESVPDEWPVWVYCSRYSARPSSGPRSRRQNKRDNPNSHSASSSPDEKRCRRTAFSASQLSRLRAEFQSSAYLGEERRGSLARDLGLSEAQVKIWFQNRRAKLKKGERNELALKLMEHGLYNHSTTTTSS